MRRAIALAFAAFAVGCGGDDGPRARADLLVTADRLFDGGRMFEDAAVAIRGRTVVAVGEAAELEIDAGRTIELGEATLLPGFIDLHVHLLGRGLLRGGVTTVRDVGSPLAVLPPPRDRPGYTRVLAAGPIVTAPDGYPIPVWGSQIAYEVRGERRARAAVRELVRRGAAVVKIALEPGFAAAWPLLTPAEVRAIVAEAHRRNRIVTAHVTDRRGARVALAGRVDELAHMPCVQPIPQLMRRFARRDVAIVGTLDVVQGCPFRDANARTFVAAGGRLLYGSDYGNPGIPAGIDVEELRLMVRAGLSPREAVTAATAEAGRQLGRAPLGTLRRGAPADVIAVRGDPFRSLVRLEKPILVIAGGQRVRLG